MSEKQTQQHSQHFNLSGEVKQKLEQLTARRYPGKKRKQSQLVEDLITQEFAKEYAMSTATTAMQEPEPNWLAPFTQKALGLAQQAALHLKATAVAPEHLLLGLVEQSEKGVLSILATLQVDVPTMRSHFNHLLTSEHQEYPTEEPPDVELVEMQHRREELFNELKPGEVRRGIVSQLAHFGAFVDLGGAHGLVHLSQLTWNRINHPSEVVHVGQEVKVQILSVDKEKKKIALSIKRAEVDPWTTIEQRYAPGQLVIGIVTKTAPFGAFARIEDGVEGLIHLTELPTETDPQSLLSEGAQLQLRILRIDAERRHLGLRIAEEVQRNNTTPETLSIEPDVQQRAAVGPDVEPFYDSPPLSREAQASLHEALLIARRMHSPLVQPEHLFLSILQNQRIQDSLAPLLPFPETLNDTLAGSSQVMSRRTICPRCKHLVQAHWKHCVYCGQMLASACSQCGAPRAEVEGVRFCYECGNPLE